MLSKRALKRIILGLIKDSTSFYISDPQLTISSFTEISRLGKNEPPSINIFPLLFGDSEPDSLSLVTKLRPSLPSWST